MTKRKDLSKALDQVENSKGTHHAIDFKPGPRTAMVDSLMSLSKLMILYMDLRQAVKALMELPPESICSPKWYEAYYDVVSAMNALRDFEAGMVSPPAEFPSGVVSFDVGNEPSVTVEVFRDEAGNIIDSHEKYNEWHQRPRGTLKTRKEIERQYLCNATCEDIGCQCGRLEELKRNGLA